jgi:hypothetical protein
MKKFKVLMSAAVVCLVAAVSFVACDKDKDNGTKTPTIIGVQPLRVSIGDTITITGQNFDGVTAVKFGDVQVAKASFASATASIIKVAVPEGTTFPCTLALVAGDVSYPYGSNLTDASAATEYPSIAPQEGKAILVAKFLKDLCNDVVLLGSYHQNGTDWITTPSELLKFEAVEGYDGWYKVEVELTADAAGTDDEIGAYVLGVKPVQLKGDGTFNWDYQMGDISSINVVEGEDIVVLKAGYPGEANMYFSAAGVAVIEFDGWKNGNTPCVEKVTHNYTFTLTSTTVPDGAIVTIVGNFGDYGYPSWSPAATEMEMTKNGNTYTITLNNVGEGTEYKYVVNAAVNQNLFDTKADTTKNAWDNGETDENCVNGANRRTGTDAAINDNVPGWQGLGACYVDPNVTYNYTFTVTVPASTPTDATITIAGDFGTAGYPSWSNTAAEMQLTKGDDGKYTITLNGVLPGKEYKYLLNQSWDTEKDAECVNKGARTTGSSDAITDEILNWAGLGDCPE